MCEGGDGYQQNLDPNNNKGLKKQVYITTIFLLCIPGRSGIIVCCVGRRHRVGVKTAGVCAIRVSRHGVVPIRMRVVLAAAKWCRAVRWVLLWQIGLRWRVYVSFTQLENWRRCEWRLYFSGISQQGNPWCQEKMCSHSHLNGAQARAPSWPRYLAE